MEDTYCVYKHTAPNGKVYIGQTKQRPSQRYQRGKGYIKCPYFFNAIEKYGWENFKHEILCDGLTAEEASEIEKEQIQKHKSNDANYGYNLTDGGSSEFSLSDIGRKHRSEASKRLWQNENFRQEKIKSMLGKNNPMYGIKMSEESRRKMSDSAKGRKHGPMSDVTRKKLSEVRKKQGNFRLGAKLSEETKRKISNGNKGKKVVVSDETKSKISNATKGIKKSEETRRRMKEAQQKNRYKNAKPVKQLSMVDGSVISVYSSALDAANAVNASSSTMICACCKGKLSKAYGYRWQYAI